MKKYFAEFTGTFALVFCGTGAIIINQQTGGAISNLGIAFTFGLIVTCMIFAIGKISGAHINPAVTVAFWLAGWFKAKEVAPYIISQLSGALFASALLHLLFPANKLLGVTTPSGTDLQSFLLEIALAFILMLVILFMATKWKEKGEAAAIAIGMTVMLEALFAGPICGASMNPARSFAPAIVSGNTSHLWIYLTAPFLGAALSVPVWRLLQQKLSLTS